MKDLVVAKDAAEAEFDRWVEAMALTFDVSTMDAEDKTAFLKQKATLVGAISDGRLVVNEDGVFVFTPGSDKEGPIVFHEPVGGNLAASDTVKKGQDVAKGYAVLASMTKQNVGRFSRMPQRDLKVCLAVVALFFG